MQYFLPIACFVHTKFMAIGGKHRAEESFFTYI